MSCVPYLICWANLRHQTGLGHQVTHQLYKSNNPSYFIQENQNYKHSKVTKVARTPRCANYYRDDCKPGSKKAPKGAKRLNSSPLGQSTKSGKSAQASQRTKEPKVTKVTRIYHVANTADSKANLDVSHLPRQSAISQNSQKLAQLAQEKYVNRET